MKNIAIAVLLLILLLVAPVSAGIQGARGFEKTALDATFALYGQRDDPKSHKHYQPFLCTAFIFQADATGYLLLSAGHCVKGSPADSTFAVAEQLGGTLLAVTPVSAHLEKGVDDYAVFHLATSKKYPVLELGDETLESVGNSTINPNFAYGTVKQIARGVISSQEITTPDIVSDCSACVGQFIVQEFAGGGASGSPVISATTHKVIGMLVTQMEASGFGIEPISTIRAARLKPNEYDDLHRTIKLDIFELLQQGEDEDN